MEVGSIGGTKKTYRLSIVSGKHAKKEKRELGTCAAEVL